MREACTHTHTWECAHTYANITQMYMREACTHTPPQECAHIHMNTTRMHMREVCTHTHICEHNTNAHERDRDTERDHLSRKAEKKTGIKIKSGSDIDQSANTQCYSQDKGHELPSYLRIITTSIRLCPMGNNRHIKHFTCSQALRLILIFYIINNGLCIIFY